MKVGFSGLQFMMFLSIISFSVIAVVFYKIFVNSIMVFQRIGEKRAYSIEEIMGASLLLAISVTCFGDLNVFGFSIRNIFKYINSTCIRMEKWSFSGNNSRSDNRGYIRCYN